LEYLRDYVARKGAGRRVSIPTNAHPQAPNPTAERNDMTDESLYDHLLWLIALVVVAVAGIAVWLNGRNDAPESGSDWIDRQW
jgi:hypothetical protein